MGTGRIGLPEIMVQGVDENTKILRVIYAGQNETEKRDDIVCLAVNVFWEDQEFYLPALSERESWYVAADTTGQYLPAFIPDKKGMRKLLDNRVRMQGRSVCIFVNGE